MTPEQAVTRRETRIDALIDRVEAGASMTADDWRRIDQLNTLDLMSVELGASREILEREAESDGVERA
jgi:ribosome assembly protein YihI (activator of Der GTPase)